MLVFCEARAAAAPAQFAEERAQRDVEFGVLPVRARCRDREEQHAPVRRRGRGAPSSPSASSSSSSSVVSLGREKPRRAPVAHRGDGALSRAVVARPGTSAHLAE